MGSIINAQSITIPTAESDQKVLALINLHEHGQLLVTQSGKSLSFNVILIDNEMNLKWETEYAYTDGNGRKAANFFSFLHNKTTIYIINQTSNNFYGELDIKTGALVPEKVISGTSELRRGEFYMVKDVLYQANVDDNLLLLQEVKDYELITRLKILPPETNNAIKKASLQIINIRNDTILAYQSFPEYNHRKLHLIFYKFLLNGDLVDSAHNELALTKHSFAFNSLMDLNCQYFFEHKGKIYMFGNLAPRLSDNFGQFPASNESRGLWWASFNTKFHTDKFVLYPFSTIFQKNEDIVFSQEKYYGVKADGDSGFFLNMNLIPGGVYTGNLTYYINKMGVMKWFSNTDNRDNFMRYNEIFARQYIKSADVMVTNDEWNFYSSHQYSKLIPRPEFQSKYTMEITNMANKYSDDSQKSELAYTILYKEGFAIIAEYYNKKKKEVKLKVVR